MCFFALLSWCSCVGTVSAVSVSKVGASAASGPSAAVVVPTLEPPEEAISDHGNQEQSSV